MEENKSTPEDTQPIENLEQEVSESKQEMSSTDESVRNYEEEISILNQQIDELKDKYLRLYADFDNFRKRQVKERQDMAAQAGKDVVAAMIPVLDDMERALKMSDTASDISSVKEGVNLIFHKMKLSLEQKGLKAMSSLGEDFDAEKHEAITEIPVQDAEQNGKVIDEVEKGYWLHDKIIRYAKVVVGKHA